jgi:hypothetical protein
MEAWAVFTDTEDVGGPERKIDRLGLLNKEGCEALPFSGLGADRAGFLEDGRCGKFIAGPAWSSVGAGDGGFERLVAEKDHVGACTVEGCIFRSARRLCKACDDESPSCPSGRSWLAISKPCCYSERWLR